MNARLVQCLLLALALQGAGAESLNIGASYTLNVTDIDGGQLSTSDGHITLVCIVTRAKQHDARAVADRVPRIYYGDPKFRMIAIANLSGSFAVLRPLFATWIRHRVDLEAERLQAIYRSKGVDRTARQDIYVVTDLTGDATARFGLPAETKKTNIFLFGGDGSLLAKWDHPPPADDIAGALERAGSLTR